MVRLGPSSSCPLVVEPMRGDWASFCQGKIPWNISPLLAIELGPWRGQTVRYMYFQSPTKLSWLTVCLMEHRTNGTVSIRAALAQTGTTNCHQHHQVMPLFHLPERVNLIHVQWNSELKDWLHLLLLEWTYHTREIIWTSWPFLYVILTCPVLGYPVQRLLPLWRQI